MKKELELPGTNKGDRLIVWAGYEDRGILRLTCKQATQTQASLIDLPRDEALRLAKTINERFPQRVTP